MRSTFAGYVVGLMFSMSTNLAVAEEPANIGGERQLFFDDRLVSSSAGLTRTWHRPEKLAIPVLSKEQPWEGMGPYIYGTALRDPSSGQFKLWYNCYVGGRPDYFTCYATSEDGLHWQRPPCDVVSDTRLPKGNNVVMLGSGLPDYRQCLSPSVFYRPDETDPARRYAMTYWDINAGANVKFFGVCVAYSPDGIRWTNAAENPVFVGASDVTDAQYDPVRKCYLLHYKIWRVEGEVVGSKLPRGTGENISYWPTWNTIKLSGEQVRYEGQVVDFTSDDTTPMSCSIDFSREPTYRRVVARAESKDLIHWTDASLAFELPEAGDPDNLSTYGMSTFSYAGRYLGLLRVFHNEREIDLELAVSDDDRTWKRTTPGKPFIPLGAGGSFDAGMVFSAYSPVIVGDELWFYYGAFTGHHAVADTAQSAAIGLAKLRRDGFVSFAADGSAGDLVTVPLQFTGNHLLINAAASRGELRVELRAPDGTPLPSFTFADCDVFTGDAVSHPVTWQGKGDVRRWNGKTVQLAFRLKNAWIYAYQVDVDEK